MGKQQMLIPSLSKVYVEELCPKFSQASFGLSCFIAHHLTSILWSLQYLRGKRRNPAHTDSTATRPERILASYVLEFGWPTTNFLPLHKWRHPME